MGIIEMYEVVDKARREAGLPVPEYRKIKLFEPARRKMRINVTGDELLVISDKMPSDHDEFDYMRYATVIGHGKNVHAVYYRHGKAVVNVYVGQLGPSWKCVEVGVMPRDLETKYQEELANY
jgi:hypothetical protein